MLRQICSEFKARKPRPSKECPNVTLILPVQYPFEGVGSFLPWGMGKRLLYTATSRSLPKKSRKNTNAKAPPKVISPKPCLGRKSPKLGTRPAIPWEPKVAPEWEMQWRKLKTLEMDLGKCI
jgi:hypothetical protein